MDPPKRGTSTFKIRLPRTRGDGPSDCETYPRQAKASPHTRGWTASGAIADITSSGFPAHAGMDPRSSELRSRTSRLPRTRGDGPTDGTDRRTDGEASPHTRGWTRLDPGGGDARVGFPAHAGMDPPWARRTRSGSGLPRTRGDGPVTFRSISPARGASPHTRGWTPDRRRRRQDRRGFPAHAGMDPSPRTPLYRTIGLPRTRGDGPLSDDYDAFFD